MKKFLICLLSVLMTVSLFSACNDGTSNSSSSSSSTDITAEESSSDSLGDSSSASSEDSSDESSAGNNDESTGEGSSEDSSDESTGESSSEDSSDESIGESSSEDSSNDSSEDSSSADSSEDDNADPPFTTWMQSFTKGGETKEYTIKWYKNAADDIYGVGYVNGVKDGLIWTYTANNGTDTPIVENWQIESNNTENYYKWGKEGPDRITNYFVPSNREPAP